MSMICENCKGSGTCQVPGGSPYQKMDCLICNGSGNAITSIPFSSESEKSLLLAVKKHYVESVKNKITGTLTIEVEFNNGGLGGKWISTRCRER